MSTPPAPRSRDRAVLALLPTVAVISVLPVVVVAGRLQVWMVPAVVLAAASSYARPDSAGGLVALGVVALVWLAARPGGGSAWTLVVALLMFTAHACLSLQSTAPPGAAFDPVVKVRWLARSAVVTGLTAAIYVAALGFRHLPHTSTQLAPALSLALIAGVALLLRREALGGRTPEKP